MAKSRSVVSAHLERISRDVFREYPGVIAELLGHQQGIYALYRHDRLYYVGLAANLNSRLKQHLKDRHGRAWDRFSAYVTARDEHTRELESLLLRMVDPRGNQQTGRLARSRNLFTTLNRRISEEERDRRARIVGGNVQRRRRKARAANSKGEAALNGAFDRRTPLKAWRNGWEYTATLYKNGRIFYAGEMYESPSRAAKAALEGTRMNGWSFWHYKARSGEWIQLRTLRR